MKLILKILFKIIILVNLIGCVSLDKSEQATRSISTDQTLLLDINTLQTEWHSSNFSDPMFHNNNYYKYLVHTSANNKFYEAVLPKRQLSGTGRLSVSVINQDHIGTFRNAGVILSIPQTNFKAAHVEDMGECEHAEATTALEVCFDLRFKKYGLPSPDEILQSSEKIDAAFWNEVFISLTPIASEDPKITALFLKVDSFGHCLAEEKLCKKLEELSIKYKYNLIKIPPPKNEIWLVGYPEGGKIENPFGYFFRSPPFEKMRLPITESDYKVIEAKAHNESKKLFITTAEFVYGATPAGIVTNKSFFHITSESNFKTVKRDENTRQYVFSEIATPLVFKSE